MKGKFFLPALALVLLMLTGCIASAFPNPNQPITIFKGFSQTFAVEDIPHIDDPAMELYYSVSCSMTWTVKNEIGVVVQKQFYDMTTSTRFAFTPTQIGNYKVRCSVDEWYWDPKNPPVSGSPHDVFHSEYKEWAVTVKSF